MPDPPLESVYVIAEKALTLPPGDRSAFVVSACSGDRELVVAVQAFLDRVDTDDGGELEAFAQGQREQLGRILQEEESGSGGPGGDWAPDEVGPFRILSTLGRGGMGIVFEAVQDKPRRTVALKLLHPGSTSSDAVRRFHLEGEALGRLQHPGIAQVYATETADVGFGEQPYLAMELIQGRPCLEYVHAEGLSTSARVALLAKICDAVEHAHQRGIVHRDIKPDNVLVDGTGQPKLLDFGIARVTEGSTLWSSQHTEHGQLLGTMAYMAPEQVRGSQGDIGPAADIYALGAMGFELLSAQLPRDIAGLSVTQAMDRLLRIDAKRLRSVVPGADRDLDTILGKALENQPKDRYSTAAAMAADLRNQLAHRTVSVRPPTSTDRAVKFIRRNRTLALGVAATLFALLAGVVATGLQIREARRAEGRAVRSALRAEQLTAMATLMSRGGSEDARVFARANPAETTPDELKGWEWLYAHSFLAHKPLTFGEGIRPLGGDWSPDGERVVLVGEGGLGVYGARDGAELDHYTPPAPPAGGMLFLAAAWEPNGERVAWAGIKTLGVYDTKLRKALWVRHDLKVRAPVWDLDRDKVWMTLSGSSQLRAFDANTGEIRTDYAISPVDFGIVFDPATRDTIRSEPSGALSLYRKGSATPERSLGSHGSFGRFLAWKPDGKFVATTSWDRRIAVWDVDEGRNAHWEDSILMPTVCLDWHPDRDLIMTAGHDGAARIWNAGPRRATGGIQFEERFVFDDHPYFVTAAKWNPDGKRFLCVSEYTDARIWHLDARLPQRAFRIQTSHVASSAQYAAWHPRSQRLLVRSSSMAEIWNVGEVECLTRTRMLDSPVFSPDGSKVASSTVTQVLVHDAETLEPLSTFEIPLLPGRAERDSSGSHSWSPNGSLYGVHDYGIWKLSDGGPARIGEGLPGIKLIGWTPKGDRMIVAHNAFVLVIDPLDGTRLASYTNPSSFRIVALAVDPAGERVALADGRLGIQILSLPALEPICTIPTPQVASLSWSPDGGRVASASFDGTVRLWETSEFRLSASFPCDIEMSCVRWSPDGKVLAAIGMDDRVLIWDAGLGYEAHGPPRAGRRD